MTTLESDSRYKQLRQWFHEFGGATNDAVEMYMDPLTGASLRVRPDANKGLSAGDGMVVKCPLATSLSYLNALVGGGYIGQPLTEEMRQPAFPQAFMDATPPHVIGRFFLVQQYLAGVTSHWHPYIAALPQPGDFDAWGLPAVWLGRPGLARACELLQGTNAEVAARTMADLISDEYEKASAALKESQYHDWAAYTPALYEWAYCMFTSRSFRPSLVLPPLQEPSDVTALSVEGAGQHSELDIHVYNRVRQALSSHKIDDFSVLLPVLDLGNHNPAAHVSWETSKTPVSPPFPLSQRAESIAFHTRNAYAPGDQVFNNYGLKTNSELLVGYGFVLPPTPQLHNDYIHLRKMGGPSGLTANGVSGEAADTPPPSFLLSLRPINDPSSVVGRRRPRMSLSSSTRLSDFVNFEDGLLWDMLLCICTESEREALTRYAACQLAGKKMAAAPMQDVYASAPVAQLQAVIMDTVFGEYGTGGDDELQNLLLEKIDAVRQSLLFKAYGDRKTLRRSDRKPYADSGGVADGFAPANGFERLASQYREQYRQVVTNAFKSLLPDASSEESSDDSEDE